MELKSCYYSVNVVVVQLGSITSNEIHWVAEAEKKELR